MEVFPHVHLGGSSIKKKKVLINFLIARQFIPKTNK